MLSKSDSKFIKSLQLKKHRKNTELFITEGKKNLQELFQSDFDVFKLLLTPQFYEEERNKLDGRYDQIEIVDEKTLTQCGTFSSNQAGLAVVKNKHWPKNDELDNLTLLLDEIRDPGNLGTIIRIADWYGLKTIVCSETCADCYNSKVINSSMGSFFRVQCLYVSISEFLDREERPILAAVLDGESVHNFDFPNKAVLIIGNEASGIRPNLSSRNISHLSIPGFGKAESLNAAVATAIFCDNFIRNSTSR